MKSIDLGLTGKGSGANSKARVELHDLITVVPVGAEARARAIRHLRSSLGARWVVTLDSKAANGRSAPAPTTPGSSSSAGGSAATSSAAPAGSTAVDVAGAAVAATRAVADAERAVADARAALAAAEETNRAAQQRLAEASVPVDEESAEAIAQAEARLEIAQAGAASARRSLEDARSAASKTAADRRAAAGKAEADHQAQLEALAAEQADVAADRRTLTARIAELGPAPEPKPVEEALAGLRRLRDAKPQPSPHAISLADRWVKVRARLAELPAPPAPPDWLVIPAMAALNEARAAVAEAESAKVTRPDPAKVDALEAAHRSVLEAEQRTMTKASRANRKRLEQVQAIEREALTAIGATTYGDYLQRIATGASGADARIDAARAALSDAEAVWEELHGGAVSPEYTEAKGEEASVRAEALSLLGVDEVDDDELEGRLRGHLETVVDTSWASDSLAKALRAQRVEPGDDVEADAAAFLASVPAKLAEREALDRELLSLDERLRAIDIETEERKADSFFGADPAAASAATSGSTKAGDAGAGDDAAGVGAREADAAGSLDELAAALEEAERAEAEASAALTDLRRRLEEQEDAHRLAVDAGEADEDHGAEVERARLALVDAEQALEAAMTAASAASAAADEAQAAAAAASSEATEVGAGGRTAGRPSSPEVSDGSSSDGGIARGAWLLARLGSLAGAPANTPVVIDGRVAVASGATKLLERVAQTRQVVVLGDDAALLGWAAGLGDRAIVRTI